MRALAPVAANRTYNLVGDRGHDDPRDRRGRPRRRRRRRDRVRPRPHRRTSPARRSAASAPRPSSAGRATTPFARRRAPLRRVAPRGAPPSPRVRARRLALGALARRAALALAWALLTAVVIIGARRRSSPLDSRHGPLRHVPRRAAAAAAARARGRLRVGRHDARQVRAAGSPWWPAASLALAAAAVAAGLDAPRPRAPDAARAVRASPRAVAAAARRTRSELRSPAWRASELRDLGRFAIGFDERDRARLHELWDERDRVPALVGGSADRALRGAWASLERPRRGRLLGLDRRGAGGAGVRRRARRDRAVPVQHVHGDAAGRAPRGRARRVRRLQSRRPVHVVRVASRRRSRATARGRSILVHIGGHIAFEIERIAELCRAEGIFLIEDCAHAHGASWNGRRPGTWGDAGVWSFYATKTVSTGEGGMLVSRAPGPARVRARVPQLRQARPRGGRAELPHERVHRRARASCRPSAWRRSSRSRTRPRASTSTRSIPAACSCPTGWCPASTSTSSSTRSSARPARSTTRRATASWAAPWTCPTRDWVAAAPLVRAAVLPP